jgi:hypothetical protein
MPLRRSHSSIEITFDLRTNRNRSGRGKVLVAISRYLRLSLVVRGPTVNSTHCRPRFLYYTDSLVTSHPCCICSVVRFVVSWAWRPSLRTHHPVGWVAKTQRAGWRQRAFARKLQILKVWLFASACVMTGLYDRSNRPNSSADVARTRCSIDSASSRTDGNADAGVSGQGDRQNRSQGSGEARTGLDGSHYRLHD